MTDPFDILGLEPRFDIDIGELQRVYLQHLSRLHPDRHLDPLARAEAEGEAARVNEARAILADDEQRAVALLDRLGGPAARDEKALPDGFLMDIMSVREDMAETLATGSEDDRRRLDEWAAGTRRERLDRIQTMFAGLDRAVAANVDQLRAIRVELNALRYIERMIEQLDPDHAPLM